MGNQSQLQNRLVGFFLTWSAVDGATISLPASIAPAILGVANQRRQTLLIHAGKPG